MKYNILEPWKTLDPWQKKYIETEGNCFLLCGRQSGKTAAMSIKFGKRAAENKNRVVLMIAYTEKQAYNLFFKTLMFLRAKYPRLIKKGKDAPTKHKIMLNNNSEIMCYAAGQHGEGIRTFTVTDLVIDEAAPMAREVFISVSPMLSVTKGSMDLSSTPRGKEGYFFECSDQCLEIQEGWTRFYISAEDCPRHEKEFLENEKKRMTKLEYAQEYQAKFLDELRRVFSDELIEQTCILSRRKPNRPIIYNDFFLGVDVARYGEDESTFEVLNGINKENIEQTENIITKKTATTATTDRIITMDNKLEFNKIGVDGTGVGSGVVDQLLENESTRRKTVSLENATRNYLRDSSGKEIKWKGKTVLKEQMYNHLLMKMERKEIKLLNDYNIKQSLTSIQFEYTENNKLKIIGNYSHIVEGIIRALWLIKNKSLNIWIEQ